MSIRDAKGSWVVGCWSGIRFYVCSLGGSEVDSALVAAAIAVLVLGESIPVMFKDLSRKNESRRLSLVSIVAFFQERVSLFWVCLVDLCQKELSVRVPKFIHPGTRGKLSRHHSP